MSTRGLYPFRVTGRYEICAALLGNVPRMTDSLFHAVALHPERIRDLRPEVLGDDGRMQVLPARYWAGTTIEERALFGHMCGVYSFPTVELVEHLAALIAGRPAIEIGAGHGVLAEALGIPATDSRQQDLPEVQSYYRMIGVPTVRYGPNVLHMPASKAVRHFQPQVVVGCWVSHRYDPTRHDAGGNVMGVDEWDVLRNCDDYLMVGNEGTHRHKPIWDRSPYRLEFPEYVYSRATNGGRDFVANWKGVQRPRPKRRNQAPVTSKR